MILDNIANGADLLIEASAASYAECFGHRDLHAVDVVPVPYRFKERIGEAEVQEVLDRLFPEKVVDPIDSRLRKRLMNGRVEGLSRGKVTAERFFHNNSSLCCASRLCQSRDDGGEQAWRNREMEQRPFERTECTANAVERRGVMIVARYIAESRGEVLERGGV